MVDMLYESEDELLKRDPLLPMLFLLYKMTYYWYNLTKTTQDTVWDRKNEKK